MENVECTLYVCKGDSRSYCAHALIGKSVVIQTTNGTGNAVFDKFAGLSAVAVFFGHARLRSNALSNPKSLILSRIGPNPRLT